MKKILFIIILQACVSGIWGQTTTTGTSTYRLKISGSVGSSGSSCGSDITGGLQWIVARLQDGSHATLIQGSAEYPNNGNGIRSQPINNEYNFSKNNKAIGLIYRTTRRSKSWGLCQDTDYKTYSHTIGLCDRIDYNFSGLNQPGNVVVTTEPIVQINTPTIENMYISNEEYLTILLTDNIDNEYYNWEYSVGNNTNFQPIPLEYNNTATLKIKGADFLSDADFGEKIFFRVNMGICGGNSLTSNSNVYFTYFKSAPHIINKTESPVKCYDSEDGKIILNFDRKLLAGETLEYSLISLTTNTAYTNGSLTDILQNSTVVTLDNLPPDHYRLDLLGTYNEKSTYTGGEGHSATFEIKRPTAVGFSFISKTNIFCHQGADGIINLSATGGQNQYQYAITGDNGINRTWTDFNDGNNTSITNLPAGTYQITVQDSNLCPAKENGTVKVISVELTEPSAPIALSEIEIKEPTGYGLSNGYISVRVTGGTSNNDGSYNFEWRKDSPTGSVISTDIITDAVNNPFTIKLGNIPKGKYYLTIKDKNYAGASSNLNTCGIISQEYEVDQPDLLVATIDVKKIISCNIQNDYEYKLDLDNNGIPDEAETGELKAIVTGGVGKYTYQWQKLDGGNFQNISGATSDLLSKLQEGTYRVLVTDVNNNKADDSKVFNYPEVLKISLSANTILCNSSNEGIVSVTATGGTAPYNYYWNTTNTTPTVTGLSAGNYFVIVQDANKCTVSGSIRIEQPGQLEIKDILVQNPICNGASNGIIQIKASGGKTPYSVTWSNGATGENLSGLQAGAYTVTFTDANGCTMIKNYTLTDPEPLTIDLGKDITLCQGDSQTYDISIDDPAATYQWIDAQGNVVGTNSSIVLSKAGIYTATVVDSKGCMATDQIEIKNSMDVLSPEFMIASHAFVDKTVELVNTSTIRPERVEWILPESNHITVISESDEHIELKFSKIGSYKIGLKGMQGLCEKTIYKDILIEENNSGVEEPATSSSNIKDFIIVPNPNNGDYKVTATLYKESGIKLRIVSMLGNEPYKATTYPKSAQFEIPFNQSLAAGAYLIILETGSEVQVKRMLVRY